jgi:hypothetical protein
MNIPRMKIVRVKYRDLILSHLLRSNHTPPTSHLTEKIL